MTRLPPCPRCQGFVFLEAGIPTCLPCGWYQQPLPIDGMFEPGGRRQREGVRTYTPFPPAEPEDLEPVP